MVGMLRVIILYMYDDRNIIVLVFVVGLHNVFSLLLRNSTIIWNLISKLQALYYVGTKFTT